jgi:hypothetical protein
LVKNVGISKRILGEYEKAEYRAMNWQIHEDFVGSHQRLAMPFVVIEAVPR